MPHKGGAPNELVEFGNICDARIVRRCGYPSMRSTVANNNAAIHSPIVLPGGKKLLTLRDA